MGITKFTPQQVPFEASVNLRSYLEDQMRSIAPLLNDAAQRSEDETIFGDWEFTGGLVIPQSSVTDHQAALALAASQITSGTFANARIAQANVTQHQAALTIAESQITDGSILARVASDETISGAWTFTGSVLVVPAGESGVPGLSFGDANTGIAGLADRVDIVTGGFSNHLFRATDFLCATPIYISEQAAANSALGGRGQIWVKNTTPCQLWFTDDAGNDTQIV